MDLVSVCYFSSLRVDIILDLFAKFSPADLIVLLDVDCHLGSVGNASRRSGTAPAEDWARPDLGDARFGRRWAAEVVVAPD